MLSKKLLTIGCLCSRGVILLHHYYTPVRHLIYLSALFPCPSYRTYLTPDLSFWDKQGFSSFQKVPCYHAVTNTPPKWFALSISLRHPMLLSLNPKQLSFRITYYEATFVFILITAWQLTHHAKHGLVNRLQCFGHPSHCYSSYWALIFTQASYLVLSLLPRLSSINLDTLGFLPSAPILDTVC